MNRLTIQTASIVSSLAFISVSLAKPPAEVPADAREAVSHAKILSKAFRAVSSAVSPAVVSIETAVAPAIRTAGAPSNLPPQMLEMLRRHGFSVPPGAFGPPGSAPQMRGQGTGFVVAVDGYLLTNNHVVRGGAQGIPQESIQLTVGFADGRRVPATIVGTDFETDLAVLKVELSDLTPLAFADSDAAQVGDWVIALGSPFGLNDSVTAGIISAKGRQVGLSPLESYLQTDATINPGNSGGPLVDLDGKLVGINTAIESRSGGSDGIGFAIPSNMARLVLDAIVSGNSPSRGYLGVQMQPLDQDLAGSFGFAGRGVVVSRVEPGSPADEAGMLAGDIITRINGKETPSLMVAHSTIKLCVPGTDCSVEVVREGQNLKLTALLADRSTALAAAGQGAPPTGMASPRIVVPRSKTAPAAPAVELGMAVAAIDPSMAKERGITDLKGVLVTQVDRQGLGARAGLREGDVVRKVGDSAVTQPDQFATLVNDSLAAGNSVRLLIDRGGDTRFVLLRRT